MSALVTGVRWLRANGAHTAVEVIVNFALPLLIYDRMHERFGDVNALLAASGPPIVWSLVEFARHRRLDALSVMVLAGIALSLAAVAGGGSAQFLQLRETLVGGVIGAAFLISALIRKPLIFELARAGMRRRSAEAELGAFEALRDNVHFRRTMTLMTLVWGFGLIAQTVLSCMLVFALPIETFLIVSPVLGYGTMGALGLWTFWYGQRQRRRGEARRAAEAARTVTGPS